MQKKGQNKEKGRKKKTAELPKAALILHTAGGGRVGKLNMVVRYFAENSHRAWRWQHHKSFFTFSIISMAF